MLKNSTFLLWLWKGELGSGVSDSSLNPFIQRMRTGDNTSRYINVYPYHASYCQTEYCSRYLRSSWWKKIHQYLLFNIPNGYGLADVRTSMSSGNSVTCSKLVLTNCSMSEVLITFCLKHNRQCTWPPMEVQYCTLLCAITVADRNYGGVAHFYTSIYVLRRNSWKVKMLEAGILLSDVVDYCSRSCTRLWSTVLLSL